MPNLYFFFEVLALLMHDLKNRRLFYQKVLFTCLPAGARVILFTWRPLSWIGRLAAAR
jgi:hypothetical protein